METTGELFTEHDLSTLLTDSWNDELIEEEILNSYFVTKAKEYNIFQNVQDIKTIFIPENKYFADGIKQNMTYDRFLDIWNRHIVKTQVFIQGTHSVMQIRTMSNISYGLYGHDGQLYIADIPLRDYNIIHTSMVCHFIKGILPNFQFMIHQIEKMPLSLLAYENYELYLDELDLKDVTIHTSFYSFTSRKNIGLLRQPLLNDKAQILYIQTPKVHHQEVVNLWIQFFSNNLGISLMSWLRPQNMTIQPNLHSTLSPIIYEFNPNSGSKNQQLWISGKNFVPENIRVVIGNKIAIIYACSDTLIKCLVPDLQKEEKCTIQVANQNIFVSAAKKFNFTVANYCSF